MAFACSTSMFASAFWEGNKEKVQYILKKIKSGHLNFGPFFGESRAANMRRFSQGRLGTLTISANVDGKNEEVSVKDYQSKARRLAKKYLNTAYQLTYEYI